MEESIEVSLIRIRSIVDSFAGQKFSTADVIRQYSGGFYSNIDTPPNYSFNAQFGKLLKRNEKTLKITEIKAQVKTTDDNGHSTSTSEWQSTN